MAHLRSCLSKRREVSDIQYINGDVPFPSPRRQTATLGGSPNPAVFTVEKSCPPSCRPCKTEERGGGIANISGDGHPQLPCASSVASSAAGNVAWRSWVNRSPKVPQVLPKLHNMLTSSLLCAEAANEALAVFEENSEKVVEVQKQCAGDLGKFFMMMIPLATELVSSVIGKYGFEENQAGAMAFVSELQKHQDDAEIKGLVSFVSMWQVCVVCQAACTLNLISVGGGKSAPTQTRTSTLI